MANQEQTLCTVSNPGLQISDNNSDSVISRDLLVMAQAQNYHKWLLNQFDGFIGDRILDLGAGIGTYTDLLLDKQLVVAIDKELGCIEHLNDRFKEHGDVFIIQADIENEDLLTLSYLNLDTVLCFNVLEHVEDDKQLLQRLNYILKPKGGLLLIVPAYQALYGSIDETVGHYRRYNKKELVKKVTEAGFVVEKVNRMNSLAVPGWFIVNRILRKKEQSPEIVLFYDKYVIPVLSKIEKLVPPPVGLSLVLRARKQWQNKSLRRLSN